MLKLLKIPKSIACTNLECRWTGNSNSFVAESKLPMIPRCPFCESEVVVNPANIHYSRYRTIVSRYIQKERPLCEHCEEQLKYKGVTKEYKETILVCPKCKNKKSVSADSIGFINTKIPNPETSRGLYINK